MLGAADAIAILDLLDANGIAAWVTGGWGIDALLGVQTRPHRDLDIVVQVDDLSRIGEMLRGQGYRLKELWSENLVATDSDGREVATAFLLHDGAGREIDVHALRLSARGDGIPAWQAEWPAIQRKHLDASGAIAGRAVRCLGPEMQAICHTGYALPACQERDIALLRERFGMDAGDEPAMGLVRAAAEDAGVLAAISRLAFDGDVRYGAPGPGGPPGYDSPAWQRRMMQAGEYFRIVLGGDTIGGVILFRQSPQEIQVGRIFLAPAHQDKGIGRRVFELLWDAYPLVRRWALDTPLWNARNRHFYRRVGVEEIGEDGHGGVLFERRVG
jgi:lincosamide nucleotidyltransferase A/C/D/E